MKKIFISYRSVDRGLVEELVADLRDMDYEVWHDQELVGGQKWWESILENIRACDLFVLALTPASLESRPCQLEYTYADALGKPILPVMLKAVHYVLLPVMLQERQIVDYTNRDKSAFKRLLNAVQKLPDAPPLPAELPTPPSAPLSPLSAIHTQMDGSILSLEQQQAMVQQLRTHLGDSTHADDARLLLSQLLQDPALYESVFREIQQLLEDRADRKR